MRAYFLIKSGFQTWAALCNSISIIGQFYWWILFYFRIDSEIERRFCRDKVAEPRVVAEVRSQTRRRQVKSISRFRHFETRSFKISQKFSFSNSEGSARKSLGLNHLVFGSSLIRLRTFLKKTRILENT